MTLQADTHTNRYERRTDDIVINNEANSDSEGDRSFRKLTPKIPATASKVQLQTSGEMRLVSVDDVEEGHQKARIEFTDKVAIHYITIAPRLSPRDMDLSYMTN